MKEKKIVSIGYTDRSFFHHPETKEEFENIMITLKVAYDHKDIKSILICAMQLMPDKIICEDD